MIVKDYQAATSWSAQTALRDIIGKMMLADILVGRGRLTPNCERSLTMGRLSGMVALAKSQGAAS
jgi:regulator of protease activity HflC (stomatin/prohibitin superfamily)